MSRKTLADAPATSSVPGPGKTITVTQDNANRSRGGETRAVASHRRRAGTTIRKSASYVSLDCGGISVCLYGLGLSAYCREIAGRSVWVRFKCIL